MRKRGNEKTRIRKDREKERKLDIMHQILQTFTVKLKKQKPMRKEEEAGRHTGKRERMEKEYMGRRRRTRQKRRKNLLPVAIIKVSSTL